ncbi:MAG: hypothetical protein SFY66_19525 [Oculatellaceae cyanobacterium bins.114]|nr:hypothetical protein [Oculatellaceae cyanobacterium bins.114]
MCILKIDVSDEDHKFLHVELNAASEMSFDVLIVPDGRSGRHDRQLERICAIAPTILRADAAVMEMADGDLERAPDPADLKAIKAFFNFYIFKNVDLPLLENLTRRVDRKYTPEELEEAFDGTVDMCIDYDSFVQSMEGDRHD